jgi:hypothetical protein
MGLSYFYMMLGFVSLHPTYKLQTYEEVNFNDVGFRFTSPNLQTTD